MAKRILTLLAACCFLVMCDPPVEQTGPCANPYVNCDPVRGS